jgi:hypothetical protein
MPQPVMKKGTTTAKHVQRNGTWGPIVTATVKVITSYCNIQLSDGFTKPPGR